MLVMMKYLKQFTQDGFTKRKEFDNMTTEVIKMSTSKAQVKAVAKYDLSHYDKVTVKLPKGLKDEILAKGYTVSGFLVEATKEKLSKIEKDAN